VPRGHRVVWKNGPHCHSRPAGYARNLPTLYRDGAKLPAPWYGGWYRHVMMLVGLGRAAEAAAKAEQEAEREARQYSYGLAMAAVAGTAMQMLLARRPRRQA
jgi:hypothetical protein